MTVKTKSFSFIGPGNSGVLPDITLEVNGTPDPNATIAELTGSPPSGVSVSSSDITSGDISATVSEFKLVYGTNSTSTQKIIVSTGSDFDLGGDPVTVNGDVTGITGLPKGGNIKGAGQTGVPINTGDADFVTGINQGGGTASFDYTFSLDRFANPGTVTRTVTYTITPN